MTAAPAVILQVCAVDGAVSCCGAFGSVIVLVCVTTAPDRGGMCVASLVVGSGVSCCNLELL